MKSPPSKKSGKSVNSKSTKSLSSNAIEDISGTKGKMPKGGLQQQTTAQMTEKINESGGNVQQFMRNIPGLIQN